MYFDTHCHLNFPGLREQMAGVLSDMADARVTRAVCIGTTLEEFPDVLALARAHAHIWATVGVHPDQEEGQEPTLDDLVRLGADERVVAIGETGLDYYRLNGRTLDQMAWQRDRLRVHVRAARQLGKPLVIHTRSSAADTLAILREEKADEVGGVFHCFTETREVAQAALDLGFHISFSGILTFKNAVDLREVAAMVPMDRCLIETDSPYLAPAPHRGKTNTPAWVPLVAAELARIKQLDVETVACLTTDNGLKLFRLPSH